MLTRAVRRVLRCSGTAYYLRRSDSTYLFEQNLGSGTYYGSIAFSGRYIGDVGSASGYTIRCRCLAGMKKTQTCDCVDGLVVNGDAVCAVCGAGMSVPPAPAAQECTACPPNSDTGDAVSATSCDVPGCHTWHFVVSKSGDAMTWYHGPYNFRELPGETPWFEYKRSGGQAWAVSGPGYVSRHRGHGCRRRC